MYGRNLAAPVPNPKEKPVAILSEQRDRFGREILASQWLAHPLLTLARPLDRAAVMTAPGTIETTGASVRHSFQKNYVWTD